MEFIIKLTPPPSLNDARIAISLKRKGARIIDAPILREWKTTTEMELLASGLEIPDWIAEKVNKREPLKFEVKWHGQHWFKNGKPKRRDLDNRIKFLMDMVFKFIGQDDSYVFNLLLTKVESDGDEYCECFVRPQ